MRSFRAIGFSCWLLLLAACGGGGGGSDSQELVVGQITPNAVSATVSNVPSGLFGGSVTLTAPYTGSAAGSVYVLVVDPDQVLTQPLLQIQTTTVSLSMNISTPAQKRRYTQPVVVYVCKDVACTQQFRGSPQTIQKNIQVVGTELGASSLRFSSTLGVAPAAQAVSVTPPQGVDFTFDGLSGLVNYTSARGETSLLQLGDVFQITKTSTGISVQPKANFAGTFTTQLFVYTAGYGNEALRVEYEVGAATSSAITLLSAPPVVSGAFRVNSESFIDVDLRMNMDISAVDIAIQGPPELDGTEWLTYYDTLLPGPGSNVPENVRRLRFRLNACTNLNFTTLPCVPVGTHQASILITVRAFNEPFAVTVPVTYTVN